MNNFLHKYFSLFNTHLANNRNCYINFSLFAFSLLIYKHFWLIFNASNFSLSWYENSTSVFDFITLFPSKSFFVIPIIIMLIIIGEIFPIRTHRLDKYLLFSFGIISFLSYGISPVTPNHSTVWLFERSLMLLCALMILRNPIYFLGVIFFTGFFHWSHNFPPASVTLTDKRMLIDVIIASGLVILISLFFRKFLSDLFLIMVLFIIGSQYFYPGLAKINAGPNFYSWIIDNSISNIATASIMHGWKISFLSTSSQLILNKFFSNVQYLLGFWVLITQLSALLIFYNRRFTIFLLFEFAILHLGILLMSGIFFWKWILVDVCVAMYLIFNQKKNNLFLKQ